MKKKVIFWIAFHGIRSGECFPVSHVQAAALQSRQGFQKNEAGD